ncbi:MAG: glycerophosphodiester phosphodiesterase family protein [Reinekea sp.]|jgi:glycerophosphoryl diester phosphodiesterase
MSSPMPALIGHRGLPLLAPENTESSLRTAAAHHIPWVEVDVTMAGDGSLVIMHDNHLKLFGQPDRFLKDLTEKDLRQVDAGGWFNKSFQGEPLLFLTKMLALTQELNLGLNLEIKVNPDINTEKQVNAIFTELKKARLSRERLLVSSFNHDALQLLRGLSSVIQIGVLFEKLPEHLLNDVLDLSPSSIHCDQGQLAETQARQITPHYPLYCYTVNDTETFARLLSWHVSGVFCDRAHAEDMHQVLKEYQST